MVSDLPSELLVKNREEMLRFSLELWLVLLGLPVTAPFNQPLKVRPGPGSRVLPEPDRWASVTKCSFRKASWSGVRGSVWPSAPLPSGSSSSSSSSSSEEFPSALEGSEVDGG